MGLISSVGSAAFARSVYVLSDIPSPLPETGAFRMWVLERPIPLTVALLAAALLIWFIMRGQGKERDGIRAGGVLALLAAGVFAAGTLVTTEQETLKARARELVDAVTKADSTRVSAMLTDDAYVQPFGFPKDVILSKMESTLGRSITIKEHSIGTLRAAVEAPNMARTQLRVHVVSDGLLYAAPVGSWWMLRWRKEPSGSGRSTRSSCSNWTARTSPLSARNKHPGARRPVKGA